MVLVSWEGPAPQGRVFLLRIDVCRSPHQLGHVIRFTGDTMSRLSTALRSPSLPLNVNLDLLLPLKQLQQSDL